MQFYKFICEVEADVRLRKDTDRQETRDRNEEIASATNEWFVNAPEGICCFLSAVKKTTLTGGVLISGAALPEKTVRAFLKALRFKPFQLSVEEITLHAFENLARSADRNCLLEDRRELFVMLGLEILIDNGFPPLEYTEAMLPAAVPDEKLLEKAVMLTCEETLSPELGRIFKGKKTARAWGHPVHYTVEADDCETGEGIRDVLLQALVAHGRLKSGKVITVDPFGFREFSEEKFDLVYQCCGGGAVAVRLKIKESEDGEYAGQTEGVLSEICKTVWKYRRQTLTVFMLPRACAGLKKKLCEELGDLSLVELREDLLNGDRARNYLKRLAKENGVRRDRKLLDLAVQEKNYLPGELRTLFETWYGEKLKTAVYPQYGTFASCRKEAVKTAPKGSAYEELQEMIGLSEAKQVIGKALDYYKLQRMFKDMGVKQDRPAMHMVFTGNPGTAKTTAARLFARIMKENGLLSKGHLVEVGRSDLVARYVGWTAKTVQEKFKAAMGGVLFIDEAYALADDRGGSFGDEAINTIVQEMENRREDLVVIFAGYPDEMERFLDKNPGLRSRIAFHVPFADYSAAELCDIARLIGNQKGVSFSEDAVEKLRTVFEAARFQPDFGNGRYARNVVEQAKMNMASRLLTADLDAVTKETLTTIEASDIELPTIKKVVRTNVIGFSA